MTEVRCADCGYLGLRERHTREICEAEIEFRENAKLPPEVSVNSSISCKRFESTPLCFMQIESFMRLEGDGAAAKRIGKFAINDEGRKGLTTVMQRPRSCTSFAEWHQGFTPKEHLEMQLHREMLAAQMADKKAQRDFEERRAEQDHKWRKEEHDWRTTESGKAEERHSSSMRTALIAAAITAAATLAAVRLTSPPQPIIIEQRLPTSQTSPAAPSAPAPD